MNSKVTKSLKRRQDNCLSDPFLIELDRFKAFMRKTYPDRVLSARDGIRIEVNQQREQTEIWIDHIRKVYIDEHHPHVFEDVLYNSKS